MGKNNYSNNNLSQNTRLQLLSYYKELYDNLDIKSVPEMSEELGFSERSIYYFIEQYCNIDSHNENYSSITIMIMVCTKFHNSKYYSIQKEKFGKIIKKRQIIKELKQRANIKKK